jgi:hypothetical protein
MAEGLNGDVYHDKKMENCKCATQKFSWYHETKFCIILSGNLKISDDCLGSAKG